MVQDFVYTQNPLADEPVMFIDREIGTTTDEDSGMTVGIDGSEFMKELLALDAMGKKTINIHINSPGGSVTDGMAIYHGMQICKATINTHNFGTAWSMAGVIFEAATGKRTMNDYASIMLHNPWSSDEQPTPSQKNQLKMMKTGMVLMISGKVGKTEEEIAKICDKETWITSEEALENGFCDEVIVSDKKVYKALKTLKGKELYLECNKINARFNEKTNNMEIVAKALKLNKNVNEDAIVERIEELFLENTDFKAKAKKKDDELEEKEKALKAAMEQCKALEAECKALKAKAEEEAKAKEDEDCEAAISKAISEGRISAMAKEEYKAMYKKDTAGTKAIIEKLPANKVAPKFEGKIEISTDKRTKAKAAAEAMNLKVGTGEWYNYIKQYEINNK